ncbi:MAG: hypothetical protein DWP98_11870 [Bacteroidetes bacterium]|nr:MAG: hypothetical protein DWP98_11870 [Bacteroidota bacterium]MBL1143993.1 hypothetical protein [Bacteroidota bacterium]NOG56795.1 hypothetical protein [Bacteroidota bacterium]
MKKFREIGILALSILVLYGCEKDSSPSSSSNPTNNSESIVDPNDPNALTKVLIFPSGSMNQSGNPPSPSTSPTAPVVDTNSAIVTTSNGSTAPLFFKYRNVNGNLAGSYAQVKGANNYFNIPFTANSSDTGSLQLPIGIPTNVGEGTFELVFCVYDINNLVSNIIFTTINILRLGTGSLQISLSWDTETDQDLYVTDPSGEVISYQNEYSNSGGELDRDDTDGFGPENIFWKTSAPDGNYMVRVHDYEGTTTTNNFYITISGPSVSRSYSGSTINGDTVLVTTFTKSGSTISF